MEKAGDLGVSTVAGRKKAVCPCTLRASRGQGRGAGCALAGSPQLPCGGGPGGAGTAKVGGLLRPNPAGVCGV